MHPNIINLKHYFYTTSDDDVIIAHYLLILNKGLCWVFKFGNRLLRRHSFKGYDLLFTIEANPSLFLDQALQFPIAEGFGLPSLS